MIVGMLFVTVTVTGLVLGSLGGRSGGVLSITNPAPSGAQAAATILSREGVDVLATDSLSATLDAAAANGSDASTILVFDPKGLLAPAQLSALAEAAKKTKSPIVAIRPGPLAVKALSSELSAAGTTTAGQTLEAQCTAPDAAAAGSILAGTAGDSSGSGGTPPAGDGSVNLYSGTVHCFSPVGKSGVSGILASNAMAEVTVLGSSAVVSNSGLASAGNAALTFRLLGSKSHLLWYTASLKDVPVAAHPPSLAELTPEWIFPASAWLLLVALVGMFWRGRRNGPLVTEPLPVIVKSSETVSGRARLYQDARAFGTAARTLQHATLTRLARALRLGAGVESSTIVRSLAEHTGRNHAELSALLVDTVPRNDREFLTMAAQLSALEEEVAHR
ncbi:DUF4350 domain-containing protein [Arthrobacter cryoconiti]